jgi:hypothetical protein
LFILLHRFFQKNTDIAIESQVKIAVKKGQKAKKTEYMKTMNWYRFSQILIEDFPKEEEFPEAKQEDKYNDINDVDDDTLYQKDIDRLIQVPNFEGDPSDDVFLSILSIIDERFSKTEGDNREKAVFVDVDDTLLINKISYNKIMGLINIDISNKTNEEIIEILNNNGLESYVTPNGKDIFILRPHVREFLSELKSKIDHLFVLTSKPKSYQSALLGICGLKDFFENIFGSNKIDIEEKYNSILIDNSGIENKRVQNKLTSMGYSSNYIPIDSGEFFPQTITFTNVDGVTGNKERHQSAKNGDFDSAFELVNDVVGNLNKEEIITYIKKQFPEDALLVSMATIVEDDNENAIPLLFSSKLENLTGLKKFQGKVYKKRKTFHTKSDHMFRLLSEAEYFILNESGEEYIPDNRGKKFIIVDDIIGSGGSISSLKMYLEKTGGTLVGSIALAAGRKGKRIVPDAREYNALIDKFGGYEELSKFLLELNICEGNPENLTYSQVELLLTRSSEKDKNYILNRQKSIEAYLKIIDIYRSIRSMKSKEETNLSLKEIYKISKLLSKEEYDLLSANKILDNIYYSYGVQSPFIAAWFDDNISIETIDRSKKGTFPKIFFCEESNNEPSLRNSFSSIYGLKNSYVLSDKEFMVLPGNTLGEYLIKSSKPRILESSNYNYEIIHEIEKFEKQKKEDMLIFKNNNQEICLVKNLNNLYKLPQKDEAEMKVAFNLYLIKEAAKPKKLKKKKKSYDPDVEWRPIVQPPSLPGEIRSKEEIQKVHEKNMEIERKYKERTKKRPNLERIDFRKK